MTDAGEQPVRTWPQGRALGEEECVELSCATCRTRWRIHDRLRGFRLRCSCDQWLEIPAPPAPATAPAQLTGGRDPELPVSLDVARASRDERSLNSLKASAARRLRSICKVRDSSVARSSMGPVRSTPWPSTPI